MKTLNFILKNYLLIFYKKIEFVFTKQNWPRHRVKLLPKSEIISLVEITNSNWVYSLELPKKSKLWLKSIGFYNTSVNGQINNNSPVC